MKITRQIIVGYCFLLFLVLIVCGVASYDIYRVNQAAKRMISQMEMKPLVDKVHNLILKQIEMEEDYLLTGNDVFLEGYTMNQLELADLFDQRVVETFSESENKLLDFLKKNKYACDYGKINAMYYGVPQKRKRFLLVASRVRKKIKLPEADKEHILKVRDVLGTDKGFPTIQAGHIDETDFLHTTADLTDVNINRLELTPHDGGTRLSWKDDSELQINAYKGKDKTFSHGLS